MMVALPANSPVFLADALAENPQTLNDPWEIIIDKIRELVAWIFLNICAFFQINREQQPEVTFKDVKKPPISLQGKLETYGLVEMNRALAKLIRQFNLPEKLQLIIGEDEVIQTESTQLKNNNVRITESGRFQLFEQTTDDEGNDNLVDLHKTIAMRRSYILSPSGHIAKYQVELNLDYSKELYQQLEMLNSSCIDFENSHAYTTFLCENRLPENIELFPVDEEDFVPQRGIYQIQGSKASVLFVDQYELYLRVRNPEQPECSELIALGRKVKVERTFVLSAKGRISNPRIDIQFIGEEKPKPSIALPDLSPLAKECQETIQGEMAKEERLIDLMLDKTLGRGFPLFLNGERMQRTNDDLDNEERLAELKKRVKEEVANLFPSNPGLQKAALIAYAREVFNDDLLENFKDELQAKGQHLAPFDDELGTKEGNCQGRHILSDKRVSIEPVGEDNAKVTIKRKYHIASLDSGEEKFSNEAVEATLSFLVSEAGVVSGYEAQVKPCIG